MSSKESIARGPGFHLYTEPRDDDNVYLELEGVPYDVTYNPSVASIAIPVWEVIRHFAAIDLSWADKDDAQIGRAVTTAVDERIARAAGGGDSLRVAGLVVYGSPDDQ